MTYFCKTEGTWTIIKRKCFFSTLSIQHEMAFQVRFTSIHTIEQIFLPFQIHLERE